ncbi:MAG: hypothetical protein J7L76_08785, partial [Spirochaetaceae bacterium]|nr:hypothetical protein [Spirochaetaceae bacterium]
MRTSQKIALNILIALLVTGGFTAIAYTGLFNVLETDFFSARVKSDQLSRLKEISEVYSSWSDSCYSRFDALARDRNYQSVFSLVQRESEIKYRSDVSASLEDRLMGYRGIRVVDNDGRIQYSTFAGDIGNEQTGEDGRRLYKNWEQVADSFELIPAQPDSENSIIFDGDSQWLIYKLPVQDSGFVTRGWMLVYTGTEELSELLTSEGLSSGGGRVYIVESRGLIVDIRQEQVLSVADSIELLWPEESPPAKFAVLSEDRGEKYWLVSELASDGTYLGKLVPGRLFSFTVTLQVLILLTVFISTALLVFLLQNIRTDKTE